MSTVRVRVRVDSLRIGLFVATAVHHVPLPHRARGGENLRLCHTRGGGGHFLCDARFVVHRVFMPTSSAKGFYEIDANAYIKNLKM